jgi:hypothetical protein
MARLGFVAAARVGDFVEGAPGEEAHAGLAVSHRGGGHEREDGACEAVHRSPVSRHGVEVVEAVPDDELGLRGGLEQRGDGGGWMLSVSVDHEHPLRRRLLGEDLGEAGANRFTLAVVDRKAQELDSVLARETLELVGPLGRRAIVDDEERAYVAKSLLHEPR